jgi:hypothetical protein
MKTIKTHLPHFHLAPDISLTWNYDHDCIHFVMEEAFGINELDLHLSVGLLDDGTVSTKEYDLLDATVVSARDGSEYTMEPEAALEFLTESILPYIDEAFPSSKKKGVS